MAKDQGLDVSQVIIDSGYIGTIPEINKNIQRDTIPPKPTPDQFPQNKEWAKFADEFETDEDWRNHWINNMTKTQRENYIEQMSRGN